MFSSKTSWARVVLAMLVVVMLVPGIADAKKKRKGKRKRVRQGLLMVESMTDGIKLYIDGKLKGKTPLEIPIPLRAGKHHLKATKSGYGTLDYDFVIKHRKTLELPVDLIPHSGLVKFSSNIKGAEVFVDGKLKGHTPLIRYIGFGDHEVQIVKQGYNDFSQALNVKAGEKHFVKAELTPFKFSPEVMAIAKAQKEKEAQEAAAAEAVVDETAPQELQSQGKPIKRWYTGLHKKWWVWTIAGAVLVTAVTIPIAATAGGGQSGLNSHDPATVIDLRPGN